ncbi:hypothetical protein ACIGB8_28710 [Promicromonospora sukumoe]|uniref:hypothetical protein n=1 Tax=Promicromonospora sukumoe TaxID=88382 RepID=UPI0037CADDCF
MIETDFQQAQLDSAVRAARRERTAHDALGGRRWYAAPLAWLDYETARFSRWVDCRLIPDAQWDELAGKDIARCLDRFGDFQQTLRNPFHPRTLDMLDQVVPFVMERRGVHDGFSDVVDDLPPLAHRLSPDVIERFVRIEIARRQAIAADPVVLVRHQAAELHSAQSHRQGEQWLIVQHKASGMRARFMHRPDRDDRDGTVFARPYDIDSIDPDRIENPQDRAPEWRDYAGLGIGTRLYLRAAEELPDVRWGGTSYSQYAEPLRAKLHAIDPWRWRSRTCTCYAAWGDLTPQTAAEVAHDPAPEES